MSIERTMLRLAVASACAALAAVPATLHAAQRYTLSGTNVAVYNLAGRMQVVAGRSAQVEVEVVTQGEDGGRLKVQTGPVGDRQALRVIYPDASRIVYREGEGHSSTTVHVRSDGTFGGDWGGGGRRVTISNTGSGLEASADLTVYVPKGQRIAVYLAIGEAAVSNVDGDLLIDVHAARVRSEHTRGRLKLDTGSGHVDVRDAEGEVTVDTGSGGARVSGIRGNRLLIDTGSGGVEGDGIEVERLSIDTGSGGVELGSIKSGDIKLDTGSGHVSLELLSDVESMDIDTGSGGVTIVVPENLGADADIDVGSGGIDIDVPHQVMGRISNDHYHCKIGDGQGRIHIETGSGGVRIRQG